MFKNLLSKLFGPKTHNFENIDQDALEKKQEEVSECHNELKLGQEVRIDEQPTIKSLSIEYATIEVNKSEETIDNKTIVDRAIAEGRLEIKRGENNSMTVRALGKVTESECKALEKYINELPMLLEEKPKKIKGQSRKTSGHGLAVDEPYRKLNYSTEFIDYSKKGNPLKAVSMFLKEDPLHKEILADYAQRISKATKILLPSDGRIIDVNVKDGFLNEQYQPYIQHFKLPYESVAFEINFIPEEEEGLVISSVPMLILCEQMSKHIGITVFYRNIEGFWIVVNERPMILKDDFSRPIAVIKDADVFNQADEDTRGAYGDFTNFASRLTYQFLCAINCSNINTSEDIKAGKFANQKRKEKGKAPLFDYKVLVLDFNNKKNDQGQFTEGNHAKKRAHLRRGHIRRLKDRTIWVNACAVGGRADGKIEKDYEISSPVKM